MKEKSPLELLYDPNEEKLRKEHQKAISMCFQYNNIPPLHTVERESFLRSLLRLYRRAFCDRTTISL